MKSFYLNPFYFGITLLGLLVLLLVYPCDAHAPIEPLGVQVRFMTRTYTDAQGLSMPYYLYIPRNYNPHEQYPLILLLQGGGERGQTKNTLEQNHNVLLDRAYVDVWATKTVQAQWPSFIVVPQVMNNNRWVNIPASQGDYQLASQPSTSLRLAKEIVDSLQRQYQSIDPTRLYVTGISMGGYGVWDAIERWPSYFAAAAPIAGAGDPSKADLLTNLPIWDFHGSDDTVVPVSGSRDMIQALRAAGGRPLYTEYLGAGHEIWMQVYDSTAFLSWLFAQHSPA